MEVSRDALRAEITYDPLVAHSALLDGGDEAERHATLQHCTGLGPTIILITIAHHETISAAACSDRERKW